MKASNILGYSIFLFLMFVILYLMLFTIYDLVKYDDDCKELFGENSFHSTQNKIESGYFECCKYVYDENHRGQKECEVFAIE